MIGMLHWLAGASQWSVLVLGAPSSLPVALADETLPPGCSTPRTPPTHQGYVMCRPCWLGREYVESNYFVVTRTGFDGDGQ